MLKSLKLGWVAFHSVAFQLKCLDFRSNQYKKTRASPLTFLQLAVRKEKYQRDNDRS